MSKNFTEIFKEYKVLTLEQASKTYSCSVRTVQRYLSELPVLRSYNKNSRYYTLSDIPKFNIQGIWNYQGILFSKFGNLRQTVKHLILTSESGLNANELGGITELLPRSFMQHFQKMEGIFREKHDGVYVYFSNDPEVYSKQRAKRTQTINIQNISNAIAVQILVGYIKHPGLSPEELSELLKKEDNCNVSPSDIINFLSFHDLVKKTPDSKR